MLLIYGPIVCRACGEASSAIVPVDALCSPEGILCDACRERTVELAGTALVLSPESAQAAEHILLFWTEYAAMAAERRARN